MKEENIFSVGKIGFALFAWQQEFLVALETNPPLSRGQIRKCFPATETNTRPNEKKIPNCVKRVNKL